MRNGWTTRALVFVAATCLVVGFAAGFASRSTAEAEPPREAPAALDDAPSAPTVPDDRRARERARLAVAAGALKQVPRLQVPPPQPPPATPPPSPRQRLVLDELPAAVQQALRQVSMGKPMRKLELERREHKGTPYIKAEFSLDGLEQEYAFADDGKILATDVEMEVGDLPPIITSALQAALPGAVPLEVEREQVGSDPPIYEVEVRHNGRQMEVKMDEKGKVVEERVR